MRAALDLDLAVLYLPVPGRARPRRASSPPRRRSADVTAREELRYEPEAWRLAVASGMPIVLREPATWLGPNPFVPPAHDWLVLPLVAGRDDMVGVVIAAARAPIALDPVSATVLVAARRAAERRASPPRACASACRPRRWSASAAASPRTCTTGSRRTSRSRCASSRCSTSRASTRRRRAASRARLREAVAAAHRIVRSRLEDLRVAVPLGGLRGAVEATVERFERGGLPVRLTRARRRRRRSGPEAVAVVSRVLGEALANVERHAGAAAATVELRDRGRAAGAAWSRTTAHGFDPAADDGPRRRPLRAGDHARARPRLRRRVQRRAAARRRHAGDAEDAGRLMDVGTALDGDVGAGWCPHLAILVPSAERVIPALASFYGLGARRNGLLFHRALPGHGERGPRRRSRRPASTSRRSRATGGSSSPSRRRRPTPSAGRARGCRWSRTRSSAASTRSGSRASRSARTRRT